MVSVAVVPVHVQSRWLGFLAAAAAADYDALVSLFLAVSSLRIVLLVVVAALSSTGCQFRLVRESDDGTNE